MSVEAPVMIREQIGGLMQPLPEYPSWIKILAHCNYPTIYGAGWWCWHGDYVLCLGLTKKNRRLVYRSRIAEDGVILIPEQKDWMLLETMTSIEQDFQTCLDSLAMEKLL